MIIDFVSFACDAMRRGTFSSGMFGSLWDVDVGCTWIAEVVIWEDILTIFNKMFYKEAVAKE